jgi:hypothetical protein
MLNDFGELPNRNDFINRVFQGRGFRVLGREWVRPARITVSFREDGPVGLFLRSSKVAVGLSM